MALANFPDGVRTPLIQGGLGVVALDSQVSLWPDRPPTGISQDFLTFMPTYNVTASGLTHRMLAAAPAITMPQGTTTFTFFALRAFHTINTGTTGTATLNSTLFGAAPAYLFNTTMAAGSNFRVLQDTSSYKANVAAGTITNLRTCLSQPTVDAAAAGSLTVTNLTGYEGGGASLGISGGALTIVTSRAFWGRNAALIGGSITTQAAIDIDDLTAGTTNLSLRSAGAAVQMRHAGPAVFGANATPSNTNVGLELVSTSKGFRLPRMTTAQRDAAFGAPPTGYDGTVIYNTSTVPGPPAVQAVVVGAWVNLS